MATGQSLLDRMELLNQELQLQAGEADVVRGLVALNVAQDFFESQAALRSNIFGSSTGTIAQVTSTETTTYPSGVIRLDRLQYLDPATSRPAWDLRPIKQVGGYAGASTWLLGFLSSTSTGKPRYYSTNGSVIYWNPLPDSANSIRWYGFQRASDITASGTFAYDDGVMLPLASFAVKLMKISVDDSGQDLDSLAQQAFSAVLDQLANFWRDGAKPLVYSEAHNA